MTGSRGKGGSLSCKGLKRTADRGVSHEAESIASLSRECETLAFTYTDLQSTDWIP